MTVDPESKSFGILLSIFAGLLMGCVMYYIFSDLTSRIAYLEFQTDTNHTMTLVLKNQVQTLADAGMIGMQSPVAHRLLQDVKVDSTQYISSNYKNGLLLVFKYGPQPMIPYMHRKEN